MTLFSCFCFILQQNKPFEKQKCEKTIKLLIFCGLDINPDAIENEGSGNSVFLLYQDDCLVFPDAVSRRGLKHFHVLKKL